MPSKCPQTQARRATAAVANYAGSLTVLPDCPPGAAPPGARDLPHPLMHRHCPRHRRLKLSPRQRLPQHRRTPTGQPRHSGSQGDRRSAWSRIQPTPGSTSPYSMPQRQI